MILTGYIDALLRRSYVILYCMIIFLGNLN